MNLMVFYDFHDIVIPLLRHLMCKDATTEDVDGPEERQWKPPLPSELRARREVVSLQPDQAVVPDK